MAQPIYLYDGSNSVEEMDQAGTGVDHFAQDPKGRFGASVFICNKAQNTSASPEIGSGVPSADHSCGGLVGPAGTADPCLEEPSRLCAVNRHIVW